MESKKIFLFFILQLTYLCVTKANIKPIENSYLHYTSIYFEEEVVKGASKYKISVSKDSIFSQTVSVKSNAQNEIPVFTVDNLEWGAVYYWQVNAINKNGNCIATGKVHRFGIVKMEHATFGQIKLQTNTKNGGNYSNDLICLDQARTIFDRAGKAVWKLPIIKGVDDSIGLIRDIKLTHDNTLTFLTDKDACEIDFEGNVLWKAPQPFVLNGKNIGYHHEFIKDRHNCYYVLGRYTGYRKILEKMPDEVLNNQANILRTDSGIFNATELGVILKFNKSGKLLWYWDSNEYLQDVDLNYKKTAENFPNFSTHANAFSVNDEGTYAYLGMRDLCRIVKIDIETKQVVAAYDEKYPSGDVTFPDLFMFQHDARITSDNRIFVFNNDDVKEEKTSSVLILQDSIQKGEQAIIWRFDINFDTLTTGKAASGGNINELSNGNLLVCAGTLNRIFEVTPSKKVVWDAFLFCKKSTDTDWQPLIQYRACPIKTIVQKHLFVSDFKYSVENNRVDFKLNNTGNIDDAYSIDFINNEGKSEFSVITTEIHAGGFKRKRINLPVASSKKLRLKIVSITDPFIFSINQL